MRIGNINQSTNFGRIVKLHTKSSILSKEESEQATKEIVDVLNGKKSFVYSRADEMVKIKPFFKTVLGDYNGKNGVLIQKHYNENYLISGEEAEQISRIKEAVDMDLISNKKAQKKIDEIFREKVENGEEDECGIERPHSVINISFDKPRLKADSIHYYTFRKIGEEYVNQTLLTYI